MQTRHLYTLSSSFIAQRSIGALVLTHGLLLGACVAEDVDPDPTGGGGSGGGTGGTQGNTSGSGNNTSGSGGASGAATGGIMSNPEFGMKIPCVSPTQALIMDFAPVVVMPVADAGSDSGAVASADAAAPAPAPLVDGSFGDFSTTFSGGTYRYPSGGAFPIASDVSGGNWHLSGNVGDYSGFGLYFGGTIAPSTVACNVVDLAAYDGISFTLSGNVAMGNTLTMSVATSANNASHLYLNTVAMPAPATPAPINSGRCIPPTPNQYDGSCAAASAAVPVTAAATTVTMLWSQFTAGRPDMTVDPSEITGIAFALPPPPGAGTATPTPYAIDLVIDDIQFVGGP